MKTLLLILIISCSAIAQENTKLFTFQDALRLTELQDNIEKNGTKYPSFPKHKIEFIATLNKYNINITNSVFINQFLDSEKIKLWLTPAEQLVFSSPVDQMKMGWDGLEKTNSYFEFEDLSTSVVVAASKTFSWQTSALTSVSSIMTERLKSEISNYTIRLFFNQASKIESFSPYFKNSYDYIKYVANSDAIYATNLSLLKNFVESDLGELPTNLLAELNLSDDTIVNSITSKAKFYYALSENIKNTNNPFDYIDELPQSILNANPEIKIADTFSNALLAPNTYRDKFINISEIKKNETLRQFFYAMLTQQLNSLGHSSWANKNISYNNTQSVDFILEKASQNLITLDNVFKTNISKAELNGIDHKRILRSYFDLLAPIMKSFQTENIKFDFEKFYTLVFDLMDLKDMISQGQYNLAFPSIINISSRFGINYLTANPEVYKYTSFLISLSMAKSTTEIKDLIESMMLPIGSYAIKRSYDSNISINSYVGLTLGAESINTKSIGGFNYGLTAPIGLAFSWKQKLCKTTLPLSIFVSILDLGSLVNDNLENKVETDKQIKIEQFLAPGLGIFYNIPKAPITLGIHSTYNPSKRKITNDQHLNTFRYNFSVLVDIPFFNLSFKNHK